MDSSALLLGLMLTTGHIGGPEGISADTPGIYVRGDGWAAGGFRNSWRYPSYWATKTWACGPVECLAGGTTGYAWAPVVPLLGASKSWGKWRTTVTYGGGSSLAFTLSMEGKL